VKLLKLVSEKFLYSGFQDFKKIIFLFDTPKSPKGDLLKSGNSESPPRGIGVNLRVEL
jgi:hypothetical protein